MKNQFLIMEKLKDSLKGLDEATKNAEDDRLRLIELVQNLEEQCFYLRRECYSLRTKIIELDNAFNEHINN